VTVLIDSSLDEQRQISEGIRPLSRSGDAPSRWLLRR